MIIRNYPKGYSAGPDGIYYHGEHFSNALIEITDYYEVKFLTSGVTSDTYVEVKFIVEEKKLLCNDPVLRSKKCYALYPT